MVRLRGSMLAAGRLHPAGLHLEHRRLTFSPQPDRFPAQQTRHVQFSGSCRRFQRRSHPSQIAARSQRFAGIAEFEPVSHDAFDTLEEQQFRCLYSVKSQTDQNDSIVHFYFIIIILSILPLDLMLLNLMALNESK